MRIARGIESLPSGLGKTVVTIGVFDGVHLGHQAIMQAVKEAAADLKVVAGAITFDRNPQELLNPPFAPPYVSTLEQKLDLIADRGMDFALVLEFNRQLADTPAEDFVTGILLGRVSAVTVVVGSNFAFGKARRGNAALLRKMGRRLGFDVIEVEQVVADGTIVSSTEIRRLISLGMVDRAGEMLGHPFVLRGTVVRGEGLGRRLGFPTANIRTAAKQILPPAGVYAATVKLADLDRPAAVNIGTRPTVSGRHFSVEVHVLDFSGKIYGSELDIAFLSRLRDEQQFRSTEDLVEQIKADIEQAGTLADPQATSI